MQALFGLLPLLGALIAVETDVAQTCPTTAQVETALAARVPGIVAGSQMLGQSGVMRLRVQTVNGLPTLALFGDKNELRLQRTLARLREDANCPALAEAVAIIVERHLLQLHIPTTRTAPAPVQQIAQVSASLQTPMAAWQAWLQARGKPGRGGASALGAELGLARDLDKRGRWNAEGAMGAGLPHALRWGQAGEGEGRRLDLWASLALGRRWAWGSQQGLLRGVVSMAAVRADRLAPLPQTTQWGAEPWFAAEGVYRWFPGPNALAFRGAFVQVALAMRAAAVRHQLVLVRPDGQGYELVQQTPWIFADLALGGGVAF